MSSRTLFLLEFWAIVVPYGAAVAVGTAGAVAAAVVNWGDPQGAISALGTLVLAAMYLAGLKLALVFRSEGPEALSAVGFPWWLLAACGAAIPTVSVLGLLLGMNVAWPLPPPPVEADPFGLAPKTVAEAFGPGLLASPLLVPFVHLLVEKWRQAPTVRSNGPGMHQ